MKKMRIIFVLFLIVSIFGSKGVIYVNSITVNIEGIIQGTDDISYAKDAPLANIIIDKDIIGY